MSSNRKSKVRKLKQPVRLNAGLIVFAFIFIYIFVYVIIYFTKEHVAIYEVVEKSISENNSFNAVALRNEEVINSSAAGYITFYQNNASRVAVNDLVFSIDEGGSAFEEIKSQCAQADISDGSYLKVQDEMNYFKKKYSNASYEDIYTFKNTLSNMVLEMNTSAIYDDLEALISSVGEDKLVISKSGGTGIIGYTVDGLEGLTFDSVNKDTFDSKSYEFKENSTGTLLEKDVPAYKLVKDETWQLAMVISKEQYERLQEKTKIGVTFVKDNFSTTAGITTAVKEDVYYAILTLDGYMVNYINDRFIDVELELNTATGLKIPNSSIIEKDFYVIPLNLFTNGGNSDKPGLAVMSYKENGELVTDFVQTDIYYQDDTSGYVDASLFDIGTKILNQADNSEYVITEKSTLTGVYNVNKGYCEFRRIEVLYATKDYSIVKKGSESDYTLAKFDHIVLDASLAVEQELIY